MEEEPSLGQLIRDRRVHDLKVTMKAIADRMDVTAMYVSDIERGKRTPLKHDRLKKIADAYNLSVKRVEKAAFISKEWHRIGEAGDAPHKRRLAVKLARRWADLTQAEVEGIDAAIDKEKSND